MDLLVTRAQRNDFLQKGYDVLTRVARGGLSMNTSGDGIQRRLSRQRPSDQHLVVPLRVRRQELPPTVSQSPCHPDFRSNGSSSLLTTSEAGRSGEGLLDENLDHALRKLLGQHDVVSAASMGSTQDRGFFGSGVPTWTTANVELYLRRD